MFRLLVVDDEPYITDGLYMLFLEMKELDIDVYRAYSADDALDLLEKMRLDIVITDISMPGMDGIELMKKIRFNWPRSRIIFLTGLNKFEYVYEAIKQESVKFVLKTEGYDAIIEIVKKTIQELEESLLIRENHELLNDDYSNLLTVTQHHYFQSLLNPTKYTVEEIAKQCSELNIHIDPYKKFTMLVARIDNLGDFNEEFKRLQLVHSIFTIFNDHFAHLCEIIFLTCEENKLLWLLQPKETVEFNRLFVFMKGTLDTIQSQLQESFSVCLSFTTDSRPFTIECVCQQYEILRFSLNSTSMVDTEMMMMDNNLPKASINKVMEYIQNNIHEDISLVALGELVYFSPSYLSRIFKKSTGMNLKTYINEVRLNKAKELLKNQGMRIQDVSEALGFISPPYFTRFFKNETGTSPQEYRKK